ncbi:hypothetical protein Cgig2_005275 [Carnegiea gigantea]|uniref:Uncharacterized protein n=1 Tax=Carnegiea gigantea TaxID=171969 RepID=A0A9Q1GTY9_9CARY|nr:hypothetical protein Cgig2_005275 [Carnegiea gigantea]
MDEEICRSQSRSGLSVQLVQTGTGPKTEQAKTLDEDRIEFMWFDLILDQIMDKPSRIGANFSCGDTISFREFNKRLCRTLEAELRDKDSLINPITRIVVGVAIITVLIALVVTEVPEWAEKFNLRGWRIPPWLLACAVIVFTRMRKRTKDFLNQRGWC